MILLTFFRNISAIATYVFTANSVAEEDYKALKKKI